MNPNDTITYMEIYPIKKELKIMYRYPNGIPILSMEESFQLLIRLMDDGITSWEILKANGVRHTTIRNHRYLELKKRIAIANENCQIQRGVTLQECIEGLGRW